MKRLRMTFGQIINMNFGFLGIQFGWGLQMANMSAIYRFLGANPEQIPILWLAAPLTGLIVQPIIGHMSDHTWGTLGRRRPYFLAGAILSTIGLILMPNSSALWMAAALLWILDCSINISMEPFRAFVSDLLPEDQRTQGFAVQSLLIGLGAVVASALPLILSRYIPPAPEGAAGVPLTIKISYYVGAAAFLGAVLWTIFTTREYPPDDMEAFRKQQEKGRGLAANIREIKTALREMPATMKQLALVQIFTWLGLFCMWLFFSDALARSVWGVDNPNLVLPDGRRPYQEAVEWGGLCFALYSAVTFVFSFGLAALARKLGRKMTHSLCLLAGSVSLLSVALIHDKHVMLLTMVGVGIAWASILAMPYAMLAGSLPEGKTGIYMGIFNFFIVIPEILASFFFGKIMEHLLNKNSVLAVVVGGVSMAIAALLVFRVQEVAAATEEAAVAPAGH